MGRRPIIVNIIRLRSSLIIRPIILGAAQYYRECCARIFAQQIF